MLNVGKLYNFKTENWDFDFIPLNNKRTTPYNQVRVFIKDVRLTPPVDGYTLKKFENLSFEWEAESFIKLLTK